MRHLDMIGLSGLFVVTTLVASLGSASNTITSPDNYGTNLIEVYSYIGSELAERPSMIEVEVEKFDADDIQVLTGSEGLKTYENELGMNYDYEIYNIKSIKYMKSTVTKQGKTTYKVRLFPTYRETKEETEYVYETVAGIITANIQVKSYSDEDKYQWIYDYIIDHVNYDYSYINKTAYTALKNGSTICGGYSSLYYVFAKELGLNSRIAYGNTSAGYHAWNLVPLNGVWYYMDSTMGDNPGFKSSYVFKAMSNVTSHFIDSGYVTDFAFASTDYVLN
jgi:transglutaminase/protease-like cytokinesis protein 3